MNARMRRIQRIHFVGIGGSGMGGIAEVLLNLGYDVQGTDLKPNAVTGRLTALGARIAYGHCAAHIEGANVVVVSSAVPADNPEIVAARAAQIATATASSLPDALDRYLLPGAHDGLRSAAQ